ncbi:unnamed protein product [Aphanomyces euteiches]|uniref:Protein kinase domain-containing protein n=1 Tax=Aphanomyces euteiches TaxID=100861 RepID=A0A6G0XJ96_9STRA|nr:hypothetical protein Ae201684_004235 [Aphanomyces euteiches]KAH9094054.1 hypothetical protein Ae201684P_016670 [Aphanomyces euteiches]KAH9140071.1 hypothetical protein AeRB84_015678 [Aphanomyces euteiches]
MPSRYVPVRPFATPNVLLCRDTCMDMDVVVKRINDDVEETIYRSVHALGGHPHILPQLDCFRDGSATTSHLVLEYCPNGDLFDLVVANKRIGSSLSIVYFEQLASAVHALHTLGYAHNDLSLENVLLGRNMQVQLMDFGAAVSIHHATTYFGGKSNYRPPEVFTGHPWDPAAADIWALGVTFFAMLTGDFLLDDTVICDPAFDVLLDQGFRALLEQMPHWKALIPNAVVALLEQMLQVEPSARPSISTVVQYAKLLSSVISPGSPRHQQSTRHKIMRPRTLYRFNDIYARPTGPLPPTPFIHCV